MLNDAYLVGDVPMQLIQPQLTKKQAEAAATVNHAVAPPSGKELGSIHGFGGLGTSCGPSLWSSELFEELGSFWAS